VFLAYVEEDTREVERLCDALEQHGFDPWFDRRRLLPGRTGRAPSRTRWKPQNSSSPAFPDACGVPSSIRREIQYIDQFPEWDLGFGRIVATLNRQPRKAPIGA